ncbi:helix-turn-helix domain-containing protein [Bacillus horti]|uniref:Cytoskeletal protein RodZ n=1 Tax=Caldalkalibacillus horti TaxID=77523 RepID=A0ABT9VVE0_9BACI|nr:RodZ domain-containing protein [Bacillus horti]MDQ0164792.1 cytoskeletal protein RodZ [Bacillus horti]
MSELGKLLKQKRLEQDISMEKLQEETKIRKRYIEAIEQGEYNILPGQFYARAFIKSYAEAVGLNPEEILQEYAKEVPQIPTGPIEPVPSRRTKNIKTRSPIVGKWTSRILFYAFAIMVFFVVYLVLVNLNIFGDDPNQTQDPNTAGPGIDGNVGENTPPPGLGGNGGNGDNNGNGSSDDGPDEIDEVEELEPEWTYVGTENRTSTYRYENADEMNVTVRAVNGNIWMEITDDESGEKIATNFTVANQQEETWDLSEYNVVDFRFGNTASVELLINGEVVDLSDIPNRGTSINLIIEFVSSSTDE